MTISQKVNKGEELYPQSKQGKEIKKVRAKGFPEVLKIELPYRFSDS
jgi:hypothetical protein